MSSGPGWFETHAHLSDPQFDSDRSAVIDHSFQLGISTIVEIADGPAEWPKAQRLAEQYKGKMWWAAGIHPYYADQASPAIWADLKKRASHPQFVALGEIGLDYNNKCTIPKERQIQTFEEALQLGVEIDKPYIVHCRNAYEDLTPILKRFLTAHPPKPGVSPGVIHCFSGNSQDAEAVISLGFYLGVDGPLTYPNAKPLREALSTVPLDRLVLETDSPYLPPQAFRGQRNDPSRIPMIGQAVADLKKKSLTEVLEVTFKNSQSLFRRKHTH